MTVDVRAKVFCNLGTVIQASIADEALSARQGLIRCRGQVVLQGLQTPAVGSFVYFGWQRGNTIARIPRTLRVLSSFADPFRNQTTVQLGDKLVYLANLKNAKADPAEAEDKPDTPDKPPTPEPQDGPAPEEFPQSEFEFNEADSCYLPKPGQKPFLFGTPEAASKITALEPYLLEPASIKGKTALTISASSVLAKCLFALRIAQTGTTPIAQFTEDSFDLSSGYVNVIDQLLANESLYGYLNENEVLVVSFLDSVTGSGPLITSENLIDLNGLNQGILPGQQVTVSVKGADLKPEVPPEPIPEPEPDPNEEPEADPGPNDNWDDGVKPPAPGGTNEADQLRNWEYEEVVGYNQEAIFYLEDGYQITYPYNTRTEIYTFYDDQDYVTKRITKNYTIAAADSAYIVQAKLQAEYDENNLSFFNPSGEINGFALKEIRSGTREEFTYREVQTEDQGIPEPELLCPAEEPRVIDDLPPTRVEKVPITQTVYTYQSSLSLLGQLNISGIDWAEYDITTLPNYDVLTEKVTVTYYQNQSSGQTKTRTDRFLIYGNTQQGQQDTAEKGKETTDAGDLDLLLQIASDLRLEDTSIAIQQDRTYGVQQRPSETDLAKEELQKEPASGSEKDTATNTQEVTLDQQSDTTESQPNLQVDMPFGSDDGFIWTASDGFEFSGGGATQLALRYARTQNAILRGNRNGVALQIPAYVMPLYPLSWVYLQAASVTGAYRSNGMSWAMNSDGVLCSMDALFWGGVGGSGTPFFPVAPGITSLPAAPTVSTGSGTPANAITAPSGFNPTAPGSIWSTLPAGQAPSYAKSVAPTALVPVVNEKVKLVAAIKSVLAVEALDYPLTLPTASVTLITKAEIQVAATLNAAATAYVFAGQDATLKRGYRITAEAGTFIGTGFGAGSVRDYSIGTNAGTYVLDGQNAIVAFQRNPLSLEAGSFALTGQESFARISINLLADAGSFTSTSQDAGLLRNRSLTADAGSFALAGQDANFNIVLPTVASILTYTGTGANRTVTGAGFKPGFALIRRSDAASASNIFDKRRGVNNYFAYGGSIIQANSTTSLTSFDADGISLGSDSVFNSSALNYLALLLKEGGSNTSNTSGTITTTVNSNDSAGYSIFTYNGNGVNGATVGHGLSSAPQLVFIKNHLTIGLTMQLGSSLIGVNNRIDADSTAVAVSDSTSFQAFSASTITIGNSALVNDSIRSYVGYAFRSTDSIKIGTISGDATAKITVNLGFRPTFLFVKSYSVTGSNHLFYYRLSAGDGYASFFGANSSSLAPGVSSTYQLLSTGFSVDPGGTGNSGSGAATVYMAIR